MAGKGWEDDFSWPEEKKGSTTRNIKSAPSERDTQSSVQESSARISSNDTKRASVSKKTRTPDDWASKTRDDNN